MNKKKLLIIIIISSAVLLITAITLILVFTLGKGNSNEDGYIDSARSIKVVQIDGSATVNDGEKDLTCFRGMNLYSGDKVCVNSDSVLVIRFDQDKYIYLGENTKINIKSEGKDRYKTNVYVEEGKVLAEIQNKLGEDEEFFLSSNNSVMAVRGTVFGVDVVKVGNEIRQTYSVYKGVTELTVFDKKGNQVVQGTLKDISDSKIEISIPVDEVLSNEEFDSLTENWLKNVKEEFEDPDDANSKLNEVEIVVGKPSKEDYEDVIDTIQGADITYSAIVYTAHGYFGGYDGTAKKISIEVENPKAKVYYKGENENEYSEENKYEYTLPGTYRVYYKIVCEGFDDKEDFEVIQISKASLNIEYTNNIIPDKLLIDGMTLESALSGINLRDYISITGAEEDMEYINNIEFDISGLLSAKINRYKVPLILPDEIKPFYDDAHLDIELEVKPLILNSTYAISNTNGYPELSLDEVETFNKYNGVNYEEILGGATFLVGNNLLTEDDYQDVTYQYTSITENFIELIDGKNTLDVTLTTDDYSLTTEIYFYFYDSRYEQSLELAIDTSIVEKLSDNNYWYKTYDMPEQDGNYVISGSNLIGKFGLTECYINLPTDTLDDNSANYTQNSSFLFEKDKVSKVTFTKMPSSVAKGASLEIYVYFSMSEPENYPFYTIGNLTYRKDQAMDFVNSEYPVVYSLDGVNYQENLTISTYGEHIVYFKVGSQLVISSSQTVTVEKSQITSNNLNMLNSSMSVLSDDGNNYQTLISDGEGETLVTIQTTDGSLMSPLEDVYTVYTNMLKNSKYYDSMTKEELDVLVSVSPYEEGSANFSYSLIAEGYDVVSGTVVFAYAPSNGLITSGKYAAGALVSNPQDITMSIEDIDELFATTPYINKEEEFTHSCIFSIDGGKTWTADAPSISEVGTIEVYAVYTYTISTVTSVYVSIQTITLTE